MIDFYDTKNNNHGCTVSVRVDEAGNVIRSLGCSWSGHGGCLPDGWADGKKIEITGDDPEGGDWRIAADE